MVSVDVVVVLIRNDGVPLQAMLDPQAAAQSKIRKQTRKAAGKKRKMDELARQRAAGLAVKNKRQRREMES